MNFILEINAEELNCLINGALEEDVEDLTLVIEGKTINNGMKIDKIFLTGEFQEEYTDSLPLSIIRSAKKI